jgi:hypothetical protein
MKDNDITDPLQRRGFLSRIESNYVQVGSLLL